MKGLVVTAPASGAGKTVVTLGLLRALKRKGVAVRAAKSGPDYIDPQFHAEACGSSSVNLDAWAMPRRLLLRLAAGIGSDRGCGEILIVEGAMGVLDGANPGKGSTASLAIDLGLPLILVLDAARQSQSIVLAPCGLLAFVPEAELAGVILNRVASGRHERVLRESLKAKGFRVLGALPRSTGFVLPERHLGLVTANEHPDLDSFLENAANLVDRHVDLDGIVSCSRPLAARPDGEAMCCMPPPGQHIAVASDKAFSFAYVHQLEGWKRAGAEILPFSPLADQGPGAASDAVFLPGGYPELHAGRISSADRFRSGMNGAVARGASVYGECGGYMVLGKGLEDKDGVRHEMLGFLPNETSFASPRLHLGYRILEVAGGANLRGNFLGHEFHYARLTGGSGGTPLFTARDSDGVRLPAMGHACGNVSGSFAHLICPGSV